MKDLYLKHLNDNGYDRAKSEPCEVIKNRRKSTKSCLIKMSEFWEHGKWLTNSHNPGD
jgi:hypothetical protein